MAKIVQYMKLKKEYFNLMVEGKKPYEFRKASKGYISGTTGFLDFERMQEDKVEFNFNHAYWKKGDMGQWTRTGYFEQLNKYLMGTAYLMLKMANPVLADDDWAIASPYMVDIDEPSYDFVTQNYHPSSIDFLAFEVSKVEEVINA